MYFLESATTVHSRSSFGFSDRVTCSPPTVTDSNVWVLSLVSWLTAVNFNEAVESSFTTTVTSRTAIVLSSLWALAPSTAAT